MAKTNFLARVSHELRTPLHAILGMLELVEQSKLLSDQRAKIRLANEASTSLLTLVNDLTSTHTKLKIVMPLRVKEVSVAVEQGCSGCV